MRTLACFGKIVYKMLVDMMRMHHSLELTNMWFSMDVFEQQKNVMRYVASLRSAR
jgi:hypothetical protein